MLVVFNYLSLAWELEKFRETIDMANQLLYSYEFRVVLEQLLVIFKSTAFAHFDVCSPQILLRNLHLFKSRDGLLGNLNHRENENLQLLVLINLIHNFFSFLMCYRFLH